MLKFFNTERFESDFFTIAEIGQNHQGDFDTALQYVEKYASLGASAVKFQTRNNRYLFDKESYEKEYNSENAFGYTYGEHREFLELSHQELRRIRGTCSELGVLFMSTPFDEPSLDFLCEIDVDIMKVASFDLGNIPFLERLVSKKKPLVLSCGGGQEHHIEASVEFLTSQDADFCVLHCVSKYPCPAEELGLQQITRLSQKYPDTVIGLSDHFSSIVSGPVGYMLGARVFEKHVTFDRSLKGTDHSFALGPRGFENFVRDISNAQKMNSLPTSNGLGEEPVFKKLGKSLAAFCDISAGEVLNNCKLRGKIFAEPGIPVRESTRVLGKRLKRDLSEGEAIRWEDLIEDI